MKQDAMDRLMSVLEFVQRVVAACTNLIVIFAIILVAVNFLN